MILLKKTFQNHASGLLFSITAFVMLYLLSLKSFLLFHTFAELLGVGVALGIFFIAWNARDNIDNPYFLFVGISHFFIAIVSVLHTLSYKGMNIFDCPGANMATQFWILGGYMQCLVFLAAPVFLKRTINAHRLFYFNLFISAWGIAFIFMGWFPECFSEETGLTPFKKNSEIFISLGFLGAIIPIRKAPQMVGDVLAGNLTVALLMNCLSRMAFIFYVSVYGLSNMIGHFLYLIYVYYIYRAVIEESLIRPQNILFNRLNAKNEALERAGKDLETKVAQRTHELEGLNTRLTQTNNDLEDFAYIVSHDLREPLRGISNFAAILVGENAHRLDPEGKSMLETMVRLAQRQESMIMDILHYSKVRRQPLDAVDVDLNDLVTDVCDSLQVKTRIPRVEIRIPTVLPTFTFDRTLLWTIFSNLISNAIKFNDKEHAVVEIGVLEEHEPLCIYVRDYGVGIHEKYFDMIFTIFKRLHKKDMYGGGTGAGLAIVKNIIDRYHGNIWLESTPNVGTTFFFSLPGLQDDGNGRKMNGEPHDETLN